MLNFEVLAYRYMPRLGSTIGMVAATALLALTAFTGSSLHAQQQVSFPVTNGGTLTFTEITNVDFCESDQGFESETDTTEYTNFTYTQGTLALATSTAQVVGVTNGGSAPNDCAPSSTAQLTLNTLGLVINFSGDGQGDVSATISLAGPLSGGPSCAASASGAGQFICVLNSNNDLVAVWQSEQTTKNAAGVNTQNSTALNYMDLSITPTSGTISIGNSSCSSVADGTGDTVCAYNNNGSLYGVRFNAGNATIRTPQNLGITSVVGNPSCAIGNPRFSLAPVSQANIPAEGAIGDTLCAVRSGSNSELMGIAFNPAATANLSSVVDLGMTSTTDPSCINPAQLTHQPNTTTNTPAVCVANNGSNGIKGVTFDPRESTTTATAYSIVSGTFLRNPGCAAPSDGTGDVTCAISSSSNELVGVRFTPPAVTNTSTSLSTTSYSTLQLGTGISTAGSPSCTGWENTATNTVVCGIRDENSNINGIEFDPKVGTNPGFYPSHQASASDPSCTFQNINANAVSCSATTTSPAQLIAIPTVPPTTLN
jgi:hypothetical protein